MNTCNKITIPVFTKEQIAECQKCEYVSAKKRFCSNPAFATFGDVWVREGGRIITIDKRILRPSNRIRRPKIAANKARPCNEQSLKKDYETVKKRRGNYPAIVNGQLKFVSLSDYIKRRIDCYNCNELTCPVWQGCCGWMKLIYENTKCPKKNGRD